MTTAEQLNARGRAFTARQTTAQLVEAFELSDALVEQIDAAYRSTTDAPARRALVDDRAAVTTSRGWILDELAARDEAALDAHLDGTPLAQAFGVSR